MLIIILGITWLGYAAFFIVIGAVLIIEPPLLMWVQVYRYREIILKEVEITLTSEGIERRTENATVHVTWDMVGRVRELKDAWIFIANRLTCIALNKRELSQEQQAELAAFIAARHK